MLSLPTARLNEEAALHWALPQDPEETAGLHPPNLTETTDLYTRLSYGPAKASVMGSFGFLYHQTHLSTSIF